MFLSLSSFQRKLESGPLQKTFLGHSLRWCDGKQTCSEVLNVANGRTADPSTRDSLPSGGALHKQDIFGYGPRTAVKNNKSESMAGFKRR